MLIQIMKREFNTLLNSRAMRITTIGIFVLVLIAGFVGRFFLDKDEGDDALPQRVVVGVEDQMADYEPFIQETVDYVEVVSIPTGNGETWLKEELEKPDDPRAIALVGEPDAPAVIQKGVNDENVFLREVLSGASMLYVVNEAGGELTDEQRAAVEGAMNLPATELDSDISLLVADPVGYIAGFATQMLLMMVIIMGITTISTGVVEEKSSRVVEILLTSVRPRTLLLGKILGIGAFILLQFLLYIIAAVIALNVAGLWVELDLGMFIVWAVVWSVLGFFLYAILTGALASTVSRQEDLGAVTTPISMFVLIPLYLGLFLVPSQPDSTLVQVLSTIPFLSSFIMPVRQAYGVVTTPELLLAAGLALITIPLVAAIAGKIYQNSILRTGKRIPLRDALRSSE